MLPLVIFIYQLIDNSATKLAEKIIKKIKDTLLQS